MTRNEAIGDVKLHDDGSHEGTGLLGALLDAALVMAPSLAVGPPAACADGKRVLLISLRPIAIGMYNAMAKQVAMLSRKVGQA